MAEANTLAYCDTAKIMAVEFYCMRLNDIKLFTVVIYYFL
jgi:hypothetical protein